MIFSTPDMNLQVEASRADRFVQVQIGITMTPDLANYIMMAIRGSRDSLPGPEDPKRAAFIDDILQQITTIARDIKSEK